MLAHWRSTAALAALVGLNGLRIYRGKVPDSAYNSFPRVVYRVLTDTGEKSLPRIETLNRVATLQIDCQGRGDSGYANARTLSEAVGDSDGGDLVAPVTLKNYLAR